MTICILPSVLQGLSDKQGKKARVPSTYKISYGIYLSLKNKKTLRALVIVEIWKL